MVIFDTFRRYMPYLALKSIFNLPSSILISYIVNHDHVTLKVKINFSGKFNIHILRTQTSIPGLKGIPVRQAFSCAITKTKCDWSNYCQIAMLFVKMINKIKTKGQYFQVNLKPNWLLFYLLTKLDIQKHWKRTFFFIYITVCFLFLCLAHSRKFITRNSVTYPNHIIKFCKFLTSQNLIQLKYIVAILNQL